jgi:hypothetical protein
MRCGLLHALCMCTVAFALSGCAKRAAGGKPTRDAKSIGAEPREGNPQAKSIGTPASPLARELSTFEQRWLTACEAGGRLGACPVGQVRAVYFNVEDRSAYRLPFCPLIEEAKDAAIHAALAGVRARLEECFLGAEAGWVGLEFADAQARTESPGLSTRTVSCVADLVDGALSAIDMTGVDKVVVVAGALGATLPEGMSSLSKQGIRDVIRGRIGEVRACYEAALDVWPHLAGRAAPQFIIASDGSVAVIHTSESSVDNPALECCINTAVRGWRFGQPTGGGFVVVTYPFVLNTIP